MDAKALAPWLGSAVSVIAICTFLQTDASSRQEQKTTEKDHWEMQQKHDAATDKHLDAIDDKLGVIQQQAGNTDGKVDTMMRFIGARPRVSSPATEAKTKVRDGISSSDTEPQQAKNKNPQDSGLDSWLTMTLR